MDTYVASGKAGLHTVRIFNLLRSDEVRTTLGASIKRARQAAKLTQLQLADRLGVSRPTITQWESGTTTPNARKLAELAKAVGIEESQLFGGPAPGNVRQGPNTSRWVPEVSWVQAGSWTEVAEVIDVNEAKHWPCPVACSPSTFCLRVEGDSMSPAYPPGSLIYVDPDAPAEPGKRVVVMRDGWERATFKQLVIDGDSRYLKAMNPDWPEQYMPLTPDCRIIGTVVFSGREE